MLEIEDTNYALLPITLMKLIKINPPYSLKIKLSNYDDYMTILIETDKVITLEELPQNIYELVNKYDLIQHYIKCYDDEFYLHFDIQFVSLSFSFDQFFSIKVNKLTNFITK